MGRTRMSHDRIDRRTLLAGAAALATTATVQARDAGTQAVPNSSGTDLPALEAPPNACDCHMHVYDAERFPPLRPGSRLQTSARVTDYALLQKRLGTSRPVVVTPAAYATGNRVTVDGVATLGPDVGGC